MTESLKTIDVKAEKFIKLSLHAMCNAIPCLTLIISTTILIVYAIRKTNRPINKWNISIVIIVTVSFLLSFLPYFLYGVQRFSSKNQQKGYLSKTFEWAWSFGFLSSWSNPIIYVAMNQKFRGFAANTLNDLFHKRTQVVPISVIPTSNTTILDI